MLPHMQALGIRKALLMSSGESAGTIPGGGNKACRIMARQDPDHFAWACNLDHRGSPRTVEARLARLLARYPNLRADLSANSGGCAIRRDPAFGLDFLHRFAGQLLFGTDMSRADQVFPSGGWLDGQATAGTLPPQDYEAICFGNAQRLYGLH